VNLGEHRGEGIRHSMHLSAPNGGLAQMLRDPEGNWVPYSDYAALRAENKRLRKAGDAMHNLIGCGFYELNSELDNLMKAWLAAKGVQP
jgi:hypothetical protein